MMENIKIVMTCLTILVAVPVVGMGCTYIGAKALLRNLKKLSNKTIKITIETRVKDSEA